MWQRILGNDPRWNVKILVSRILFQSHGGARKAYLRGIVEVAETVILDFRP